MRFEDAQHLAECVDGGKAGGGIERDRGGLAWRQGVFAPLSARTDSSTASRSLR
jgi:hypothetical protein